MIILLIEDCSYHIEHAKHMHWFADCILSVQCPTDVILRVKCLRNITHFCTNIVVVR